MFRNLGEGKEREVKVFVVEGEATIFFFVGKRKCLKLKGKV